MAEDVMVVGLSCESPRRWLRLSSAFVALVSASLLSCSSDAAPRRLTDIVLSPTSIALAPGSSAQFQVSGNWTSGSEPTPIVEFEATGGTISASGLYTAGSTLGTFRVVAKASELGLEDTATVTIESAPTATPILVEDFSTYTSTADLHADPRDIYEPEEFGGPWGQWDRVELDQSTGVAEVGIGSSTKSMKYTWPDRTNATGIGPDAGRCTDFYIVKQLTLEPVPEIWAEFYVKFSANWTSKAPVAWNCNSNPDYKFIFFVTWPGSRFSIKNDYQGLGTRWDPTAPGQGDGDNNLEFDNFHDDQWHRVRMHAKVATDGANGAHQVWLDDVLVWSDVGILTGGQTSIFGISLGQNLNQGPGHIQTLHWGLIRVYDANPGW